MFDYEMLQLLRFYSTAIELAELTPQTIPVASTLCEIFRIAKRGFTDSEATYWAERLENLLSA